MLRIQADHTQNIPWTLGTVIADVLADGIDNTLGPVDECRVTSTATCSHRAKMCSLRASPSDCPAFTLIADDFFCFFIVNSSCALSKTLQRVPHSLTG